MENNKPKVIKSYSKLDKHLQQQIKLIYADGFADNLIDLFDKDGHKITVLPFETEEKLYMLRMTEFEAVTFVDKDDDYDDSGYLKTEVKKNYRGKFAELSHIMEQVTDDD